MNESLAEAESGGYIQPTLHFLGLGCPKGGSTLFKLYKGIIAY